MASLELQSVRLSWVDSVETATGKEILDAIAKRAIDRWGEKWIAELVKAYVKVAIANGDGKATSVNRRPQIERAGIWKLHDRESDLAGGSSGLSISVILHQR